MKLHSLEIQAFGPFANKEIIEFSALGENALFLIDGPTGAGKSSILHAVCYALYGKTTDTDRQELGLRCDHAQADVLTELSLEFSIRGDKYRITRVLNQMRPAKRGDGETEQKPTAHLRRVLDDGKEESLVTKKVGDALTQIEQIVGLTAEQFLQVMVLPQGKFRELLLAKSDNRQVILSTLFQTEIYKRIEQLLKDKAGAIEKKNKTFEDRKTEALADMDVADLDALEKSVEEFVAFTELKRQEKDQAATKKQDAVTALATAETLGKSFDNRNTKQSNLDDYLQKRDEKKATKTRIEQAGKAASIAPKWKVLQGILKDIKDKQAEIINANSNKENADLRVKNAKDGMDKAKKEYQQRDPLKAEEVVVNGYQDKLAAYQPLNDALLEADKKYKAAIDKKVELEKQDKEIEKALEGLKLEVEVLEKASVNKAEIVEHKLVAKGRYDKRSELEKARSDHTSFNKVYQKNKGKYEAADKLYKQLDRDANRIELLWFSNQAAVLAEKLKEDQPCVVCGSTEHPNPAQYSTGSSEINQEAVDEARELTSKQSDVLNASKEKMLGGLHSVTNKESDIKNLETELADDANNSLVEVEQVYKTLELELKMIEVKEIKLLKTREQKSAKENERTPIANEVKAIEDKIPELTAIKATAKSELDTANKTLPEEYRSNEAIAKVLTQIHQKITSLETKHKVANKELTDSLKNQSSIASTVIELNKSSDGLESRHKEQSQLWQQALTESEFSTQEAFNSAQIDKEALKVLVDDIKAYEDAVKALQAELGLLQEQLKDKQPPELEKLQQQLGEFSHDFSLAEGVWTNANQEQNKLQNTRKKIAQIEEQQTEIKKQYVVIGTLSKAASGRGSVRVSLERFVLGNLLDQVLSIASQRLHIMSKGQYRLIRQNEEDQKRNTTAGLDLAIDDAYTGKTRPVATLSGGESFMASLALALGLSDVVQERSGGIQLDTLFIDEGFGSLDQESLQLAINTLIDLQSTGRSIGIISHVSELKEQMAQRIEVTGSRSGSTIKTVV